MIYRKLGKSGLEVSAIGLGSWEMAGNVWGNADEANSIRTIHEAVECGINLLDTAASYGGGRAETVVGKALKGIREKVILCTKCGLKVLPSNDVEYNLTPENIRFEVERSLRRLDTDYIDLYQFHYPDPVTPIEKSLETACKMKEEGKIRAIGVSNFSLEQLKAALPLGYIDSVQLKYNMLTRDNEPLIEYCRSLGVGVLTYGSIAGGMLSGAYKEPPTFGENDRRKDFYPFFEEPLFGRARKLVDVLDEIAAEIGRKTVDVAINWVVNRPGVTVALVGAKTPAHVVQNAAVGEFSLSVQQLERIDAAYAHIFG